MWHFLGSFRTKCTTSHQIQKLEIFVHSESPYLSPQILQVDLRGEGRGARMNNQLPTSIRPFLEILVDSEALAFDGCPCLGRDHDVMTPVNRCILRPYSSCIFSMIIRFCSTSAANGRTAIERHNNRSSPPLASRDCSQEADRLAWRNDRHLI